MGRAEGFRLQAGFGVHLQRGVPGHAQRERLATRSGGCLSTRSGGCLSTSRTHSSTCGSLPVHKSYNLNPFEGTSVLPSGQSSVFALLWSDLCPSPTPGPAPTVRLVPQPRAKACTHCPICAQFPTETPTPRPGPSPTSHPHPRSFPPPQIPLGCARADIHDEADPALAHTTREHARKDPRLVRLEQTRVAHARTWNIALGNAGWRSHEPTDADAARPTDLAALDGAVADPARPCGGESSQGSRRMGTARLPFAGASPARVCDRDREAARRPGSCGLRGAVLPTGDRPLHGLRTHVLPVPRPNRGFGYEYPTSARAYCVGMRAALVLCPIQAGAHSGRFPSAR